MTTFDDSDPIVILTNQILDCLDKHDSYTALGGLAAALGTFLDYAERKNGEPHPPEVRALRESLLQLVVETARARAELRES